MDTKTDEFLVEAPEIGDLVSVSFLKRISYGLIVSVKKIMLFDSSIRNYYVCEVFLETGLVLYHEEDLEIIECVKTHNLDGSLKRGTS